MTDDKIQSLQKKQAGFTLIEILIGLTIIGLLFSSGYVSFRDFSRRQALAGAARQIQGDLRSTQSNALSGIKPDTALCDTPNILIGYNFRIVSQNGYAIEAECTGVGGATVYEIRSATLPEGITVQAPTPNPIVFKVLGQGNNLSEGSSVTIVLTQLGTGSEAEVVVTSGGEIK